MAANAAFSVRVRAFNDNGSVDVGYRGTVHFTTNDGTTALPADYTFVATDNGDKTFTNASLGSAGLEWVRAQDTTNSSVRGRAEILVGSAPYLNVDFGPVNATAGPLATAVRAPPGP